MAFPNSELSSTRSVSISVNLDALRHNMSIAARLAGDAKRFATIKADAYGHGAVSVAHALSASSRARNAPDAFATDNPMSYADGFAVVTLNEALELRHSGIEEPILIIQGPQTTDALSVMAQNKLWPVIHDLEQYEWLRAHSDRGRTDAWLKVDTGMGRLGVSVEQAKRIVCEDVGIRWQGLMTHFASADETTNTFTVTQHEQFKQIPIRSGMLSSLANSAAVLAWPATHGDWVRPGIMLYGCNPLDRELSAENQLKAVMTVEAPLISCKTLPVGATVGYCQSWSCPETMPVGYVALGYRDGLPRRINSDATVTVAGQRCPIVGRVSMDSVAIDLRPVGLQPLGTFAQFWGDQAPIDALASAAGTISYELLTSIIGRRHYTDGDPDSVG